MKPAILGAIMEHYQSGQAVTSEGLFQSALDKKNVGPQLILDRYHTQLAYANLCRNWDKREPDAERLERDAEATRASMPTGWQERPAIYSSLWYWTPNLFA